MTTNNLLSRVYVLLDILECAPVVVREYPESCLVFYQSAEFIRTGDNSRQLAGNYPVLAVKATGDLYYYLIDDPAPDKEPDTSKAALLLPIDKILLDLL